MNINNKHEKSHFFSKKWKKLKIIILGLIEICSEIFIIYFFNFKKSF